MDDKSFILIRFPGDKQIYVAGINGIGKHKEDNGGNCSSSTGLKDAMLIIQPFEPGYPSIILKDVSKLNPEEISADLIAEMATVSAANTRLSASEFELDDPTDREHLDLVERCVGELNRLNFPAKCVLARTKSVRFKSRAKSDFPDCNLTGEVFLTAEYEIFSSLLSQYPSAAVFYMSTPGYGTWIGASPECLLQANRQLISSMSLAGTRSCAEHTEPWDSKNIEEQNIVTQQIVNDYRSFALNCEVTQPRSHTAGEVEHLMSEITAKRPSDFGPDDILRLAECLSPTPALAGYPREMALDFISGNEKINRALYGGFVGLISDTDSRLYVNLRSARSSLTLDGCLRLYAGGGITRFSRPETELAETEMKMQTLNRALI